MMNPALMEQFDTRPYMLTWLDTYTGQKSTQRFSSRSQAQEFVEKNLQPLYASGSPYEVHWVLERIPHVTRAGTEAGQAIPG